MNKRKLEIEEIKKIELDILSYIHEFCVDNKIKYFINYGTLIGAVRHKGFIPWDDDIDICMPREEYERFINIFTNYSDTYKIKSYKNDSLYYNNFIKIYNKNTIIKDNRNYKTYECGVFIDIFPIDRFDDYSIVRKTYNLESFKLLSFSNKKNIQYGDNKIKDIIRLFFWYVLKPFKPKYFAKKIDKIIENKINNNGIYEGLLASKFKEKDIFKSGIFNELVLLEFENKKFYAPKNYDYILKQYYGDYNKLPPIEKQNYPHEIDAYLL